MHAVKTYSMWIFLNLGESFILWLVFSQIFQKLGLLQILYLFVHVISHTLKFLKFYLSLKQYFFKYINLCDNDIENCEIVRCVTYRFTMH